MTEETKEYIETWTRKISNYKGDELGILFDKFTALFILYNRLYNDSFIKMKVENLLKKSRYSDFEKATKLVVEFNSAKDIIDQLKRSENIENINTIVDLIKNDIFHINLADGISQKEDDLILMNNLESENIEIKVQALLSTIYNVRCNMQHGEKHFEEHQRMLLEPIIKILESIVNLQIEKLKK